MPKQKKSKKNRDRKRKEKARAEDRFFRGAVGTANPGFQRRKGILPIIRCDSNPVDPLYRQMVGLDRSYFPRSYS